VQLTTDGHKAYREAVEEASGADIDNSMLIKLYGEPPSSTEATWRNSPSKWSVLVPRASLTILIRSMSARPMQRTQT